MGSRHTYDNSAIFRTAKIFRTSVQWLVDNIRIVVPRALYSKLMQIVFPELTNGFIRKYVIVEGNDIARQTTWEVDMEVNLSPPMVDEILEFETTNWNSLFNPWWYPPSILYPTAKTWEVKVKVFSVTGDDELPVIIYFHPDADLHTLAHIMKSRMRYTGRHPMPKMILSENG